MSLDPRMQPLMDALVELVVSDIVREMEKETPETFAAFGRSDDEMRTTRDEHRKVQAATAQAMRVVSDPV